MCGFKQDMKKASPNNGGFLHISEDSGIRSQEF